MLSVEQLPTALFESIQLDKEDAQLRVINDSLINATYCLSVLDQRFLLKQFHADESTGRSRPELFAIQKKVSSAGLAPTPLYLSDDHCFYVEQWISPSVQPVSVLPDNERLNILAKALHAVHSLPVTTETLPLAKQWQGYINVAGLGSGDPLVKQADSTVSEYQDCIAKTGDLVFCHNDLAFAHIIDADHLTVIDWEYAATGSRYFDLGSAFVINRLNVSQQRHVCAEYARLNELNEEQVISGVADCSAAVNLTYKLWYAAVTQHLKQG